MNNPILQLENEDCHTLYRRFGNAPEAARVVKDAHGNVLVDGDVVALIKDLKLGGSSTVLKVGTRSKPIKLVDGDHEISCKMDGMAIGLKACFVKKA